LGGVRRSEDKDIKAALIPFIAETEVKLYFYCHSEQCSRVVNIQNSLPDSMVDADMLNTFKSRLDEHWLEQDVLYNLSVML